MATWHVTAYNMGALYSAGDYEAEDERDAIRQARRNPANVLVGLSLRAKLVPR